MLLGYTKKKLQSIFTEVSCNKPLQSGAQLLSGRKKEMFLAKSKFWIFVINLY